VPACCCAITCDPESSPRTARNKHRVNLEIIGAFLFDLLLNRINSPDIPRILDGYETRIVFLGVLGNGKSREVEAAESRPLASRTLIAARFRSYAAITGAIGIDQSAQPTPSTAPASGFNCAKETRAHSGPSPA